jgi:hypothetical protein
MTDQPPEFLPMDQWAASDFARAMSERGWRPQHPDFHPDPEPETDLHTMTADQHLARIRKGN